MAPKSTRSLFVSSLLLSLLLTLIPADVQAQSDPILPSLDAFAKKVQNGQADILRGVYVSSILADLVVQQPAGNLLFVSSDENTITQFGMADQFGSTGLLAHNDLAGKSFHLLVEGQVIYLVYGDGTKKTFVISQIRRYRALQPNSPTSDFIGLEDGEFLTASELFTKMYNRPGHVILQTCMNANGNNSWGRLFIIAKPFEKQ